MYLKCYEALSSATTESNVFNLILNIDLGTNFTLEALLARVRNQDVNLSLLGSSPY